MDIQRAIKLVEGFIADPRYPQAVMYNQLRQIFDVIDPGETALSKVIAWLLNPREGHGLGDYFIKALLRDAVVNSGECRPLCLMDVEQLALNNLNVKIEHSTSVKDKKRRIDILATDLTSKLIIVIEHKYGTKEQSDQLSAYSRWVESPLEGNTDFRLVRILMDGYEGLARENLQSAEREKWAIVSHQWLIDALEKIIDSESLQESSRWILKDLYIHLSGSYERDASFKPACSFITSMASDHSELIEGLASIELDDKDGEPINPYGWDDTDFIQWQQWLRPKQRDQVLQLHQFLIKNESLLASLTQYHRLQWIKESFDQSHPNQYEFAMYPGSTTYLDIFCLEWRMFENAEREKWPFYLQVIDERRDGKNAKSLRLYLRKSGFKDERLAEAFAECFGKRLGGTQDRRVKLAEVVMEPESNSDDKLMTEIRDMLKRIQAALLRVC